MCNFVFPSPTNTETNNTNMEESTLLAAAIPTSLGKNGKATKIQRLNAVLNKLTSSLTPQPQPQLSARQQLLSGRQQLSNSLHRQQQQQHEVDNREIEFEIKVKTSMKQASVETESEEGEEHSHPHSPTFSQSSSNPSSSPLLPSSSSHFPSSSPLLPSSSSPAKHFSPLRLKPEEKLKSPTKMTFSFSPGDIKEEEGEEPSVDPLESPLYCEAPGPTLGNYESYIKSQILSKMYLQQYVTNNLNPIKQTDGAPVGQTNSERQQAGPLDLSKPQESGSVGPFLAGPFNQTKYQVSALLLRAHSADNGRLVIEDVQDRADIAAAGGEKETFGCTVCGQIFSLQDRLVKHMASRHRSRGHQGEANKAYYCDVCKRSFARSDMLTRHMRLHTGIKPYTCRVCGQVFSRSDHLSTHQRTHTGEKPYRCPSCPYSACRRDMITRHMRTHSRFEPGMENSLGDPMDQLDPLVVKEESS